MGDETLQLKDARAAWRSGPLDTCRGIAVILMIVFTAGIRFSREPILPVLAHNVHGQLNPGDFVLPLFLFTSGVSAGLVARRPLVIRGLLRRISKLLAVGLLLSPWTALRLLGMDEITLNAILYIPCVIAIRLGTATAVVLGAATIVLYVMMDFLCVLPSFQETYLGGYKGAIFYLPVMLVGSITGRNPGAVLHTGIGVIAGALCLLPIIPADKSTVTPSFMLLSSAIALCFYRFSSIVRVDWVSKLGRSPLKVWTLMWCGLLIPPTTRMFRDLDLRFDPPIALAVVVFVFVPLLAALSSIDVRTVRITRATRNSGETNTVTT